MTDNGNGTFTITPAANYSGTISLTYSVVDGKGGSKPAYQTITFDPVNDAPTAANGSAVTDEDVAILNGRLPTGADVDSSNLTYKLVEGSATHGSVTVNADGTYTFKPDADYNGPASFKYIVVDGAGAVSVEYTLSITINPVNDAPKAPSVSVSGNEGQAIARRGDRHRRGRRQPHLRTGGQRCSRNGTVTVNEDGTFTYRRQPELSRHRHVRRAHQGRQGRRSHLRR